MVGMTGLEKGRSPFSPGQPVPPSMNMRLDPDALHLLSLCSGGLPKLMHEIGEAVYWEDQNGTIDFAEAAEGVLHAADVVGGKYFEPVRRALWSADCRSILGKLGDSTPGLSVQKTDLERDRNETDRGTLGDFLPRMKRLPALSSGETRGEYLLSSRLTRLHLHREAGRKHAARRYE